LEKLKKILTFLGVANSLKIAAFFNLGMLSLPERRQQGIGATIFAHL